MSKIRAFIDLGTNTFHLLIADIADGKANILFRTKEIVGLGAGGINEAQILPDAMARGISCLKAFKVKCEEYNTESINAFGTSALRISKNSDDFISKVSSATGINIEVIDGEREAELIQLGISADLSDALDSYLIMDIGGGSTEFIMVKQGKTVIKQSFEVGVQRLLSSYYNEDPMPLQSYQEVKEYLAEFLKDLKGFKEYSPKVIVGASGTYTTLLNMFSEDRNIDYSTTTMVPAEFFDSIFSKILSSPRQERLMLPGMSAPRVDLIVVGSCLVDHVLKYFNFDGFHVSGNGLKEGAMLLASKGKL